MKKFLLSVVALVLACATAFAQNQPAPAATPQKPAPVQQQPAALPNPGEAPAQRVAKAPEAKSPEEYKAYQGTIAVTDPTAAEAAADEFAKKYPTSELRVSAYSTILQKAYDSNDTARILSLGRKVLAIEPDNAMTLVVTATALAETTRETDLDYAEKFAEASKLADGALKSIETMLPQPNVTPEQFETLKSVLRSMAYAAKGYMAMNRKDYAAGEENFQKAIDANPAQQDPVMYLRLAVAQDNLKKYAPGFANATKAVQIAEAQSNPQVANLARSERDRLQKLMGTAPPAKASVPATPPKK
jgi:tetratricopeptide (TPR) repeat protein